METMDRKDFDFKQNRKFGLYTHAGKYGLEDVLCTAFLKLVFPHAAIIRTNHMNDVDVNGVIYGINGIEMLPEKKREDGTKKSMFEWLFSEYCSPLTENEKFLLEEGFVIPMAESHFRKEDFQTCFNAVLIDAIFSVGCADAMELSELDENDIRIDEKFLSSVAIMQQLLLRIISCCQQTADEIHHSLYALKKKGIQLFFGGEICRAIEKAIQDRNTSEENSYFHMISSSTIVLAVAKRYQPQMSQICKKKAGDFVVGRDGSYILGTNFDKMCDVLLDAMEKSE